MRVFPSAIVRECATIGTSETTFYAVIGRGGRIRDTGFVPVPGVGIGGHDALARRFWLEWQRYVDFAREGRFNGIVGCHHQVLQASYRHRDVASRLANCRWMWFLSELLCFRSWPDVRARQRPNRLRAVSRRCFLLSHHSLLVKQLQIGSPWPFVARLLLEGDALTPPSARTPAHSERRTPSHDLQRFGVTPSWDRLTITPSRRSPIAISASWLVIRRQAQLAAFWHQAARAE